MISSGFDLASIVGSLLAILAILGGQVLGGGSVGQILQLSALLIVGFGTLSIIFLAYPISDVKRAFRMVPWVYRGSQNNFKPLVKEIVAVATIVRKEGLLAVEALRGSLKDPLLVRSLKYIVDGLDPAMVREILDAEIGHSYESDVRAAEVFTAAGRYAPLIGLLGLVLGLIQAMMRLKDFPGAGEGVAFALVAPLYGIALAYLVLVPWGMKLKQKAGERRLAKEIVRFGVMGIAEGLAPNFLQERLEVLAGGEKH